jgi:hypothetical protein
MKKKIGGVLVVIIGIISLIGSVCLLINVFRWESLVFFEQFCIGLYAVSNLIILLLFYEMYKERLEDIEDEERRDLS